MSAIDLFLSLSLSAFCVCVCVCVHARQTAIDTFRGRFVLLGATSARGVGLCLFRQSAGYKCAADSKNSKILVKSCTGEPAMNLPRRAAWADTIPT